MNLDSMQNGSVIFHFSQNVFIPTVLIAKNIHLSSKQRSNDSTIDIYFPNSNRTQELAFTVNMPSHVWFFRDMTLNLCVPTVSEKDNAPVAPHLGCVLKKEPISP